MPSRYPMSHVPMPWGNVDTDVFAAWGQWAGGIGSILAVVVALVVLTRDRRIHNRAMEASARQDHEDRERVRTEEVQRRVGQARTVVGGYADVETSSDLYGKRRTYKVPGIRIGNYGTRPVLEVMLESVAFHLHSGGVHSAWSVAAPPRFASVSTLSKAFRVSDVLAPGEQVGLQHLQFEGLDDQMRDYGTAEVTFSFLDAEGFRWRRVGSDTPSLIADVESD